MSTVNVMNSATSSGAMQSGGTVPQPVIQQPVRSDAEVVAQVANTIIKPSSVDAASQPTSLKITCQLTRLACKLHKISIPILTISTYFLISESQNGSFFY